MKILQILILFVLFCAFAFAARGQACGMSFTYLFISDSSGKQVKNATIELFSIKPETNEHLKSTKINWVEEKLAYLVSHGICSEHFNVGLRISAEGFETIEQQINLPFMYQSFDVVLKRKAKEEKIIFEQRASLSGKVSYEKPSISSTTIILTDEKGKKTQTRDSGYYRLDVPSGKYKVEFVETSGFAPVQIETVILLKDNNSLDIMLKLGENLQFFEVESVCEPNKYNNKISDCILTTKNPK